MRGTGLAVKSIENRELRGVYVCYDCNDKHWKEFNTGWMSSDVAVVHRLKGHDVRKIEVIPDEGIIVLQHFSRSESS